MADKFSLDDILEEYSTRAKNTREDDFDVEKLLSDPLGYKRIKVDKAEEKPEESPAEPTAEADSEQAVETAAETDAEAEPTAEAAPEAESGTESEAKPEVESEAEPTAEANSEQSAEHEAEAEPTSEAESESEEEAAPELAKSVRVVGIDSVDVDSLVEQAVVGVETTDEPIVTPETEAASESAAEVKPEAEAKAEAESEAKAEPKAASADESDMDIKLEPTSAGPVSVELPSADEPAADEPADAETDFGAMLPKKHTSKRAEEELIKKQAAEAGAASKFRLRKTSGNTAIIEGLMKLKRERRQPVSRETPVTPVKRLRIKDVDLNLGGKLIPKTEQFDVVKEEDIDEFPEDASYAMKMKILSDRRKNKIKNFVLRTDDRDDSETEHEVENTIGDFTDYKNASKVLADIVSLKNNLTIRLCVLILTSLFSVYISLANDLGWPIIEAFKRTNDTTYIITNVVLGLISAFVSYTVITAGFKKLIKRQADCDSIAAISITAAVVVALVTMFDSAMMQTKSYNLYMSVAILTLLFNTLGKLLIVNRTQRNFRYVAGEFDKYAITPVVNEDVAVKFTKGAVNDFPELATMRKTEFNEDFLKNSYSTDAADRFCKTYAPLILIVSLVVGLLALVCDRNATGFGERLIAACVTFSGTVSMISSFALMFVVNLPLERASKKYLQSSAVMLGYSAVEDFSDTNSVLVDARQLFPEGMINLVNLKAMSSASIEESILMAASLAFQANSVLKPTFNNMLKGKTEMLYPVESYIFEDGLGLSGWIENKRVLLGSRELMSNHSIEGLPTITKEKEYTRGYIPVYLSVGGVVTALFVIRANASISVKKWLTTLQRDRVTTVIRTADGFISLGFLSKLFDVEPDYLKLLPFRFHTEYEKETGFVERARSSMLCSGHFPSFAMLIDGVKKLQFIANVGVTIQMAAALLGGLIALVMTIFGTFSGLSASVVILYNIIWLAVTVISQFFKRL